MQNENVGQLAFLHINEDLKIPQKQGEAEEDYNHRIIFTAARYWTHAAALDDSKWGTNGVSRKTLEFRLRDWIINLSQIDPSLTQWFEIEEGGLDHLINLLLDSGDLIQTNFSDLIRTNSASVEAYGDLLIVSGFITSPKHIGTHSGHSLITNHLSTESIPQTNIRLDPYQPNLQEFKEVEFSPEHLWYARITSESISLKDSRTWSLTPEWVNNESVIGFTTKEGNITGLARMKGGQITIQQCRSDIAQKHLLFLRSEASNPVIIEGQRIDDFYTELRMDQDFLVGDSARLIKQLSWPGKSVSDHTRPLFRNEVLSLIEHALIEDNVLLDIADSTRSGPFTQNQIVTVF